MEQWGRSLLPTGDGREEDAHQDDEGRRDVGDDVALAAITALIAADPVADLRVARPGVLCTDEPTQRPRTVHLNERMFSLSTQKNAAKPVNSNCPKRCVNDETHCTRTKH